MQRAIKKEAGDNYLKRIVVAFLAVIMMTTMLRPQIVQAASAEPDVGRTAAESRRSQGAGGRSGYYICR